MENSFITYSRQLIEEARNRKSNLVITGHNSKKFYGNPDISPHMELDTTTNDGIIDYDPSELVVRVRSGTSIINLEKELFSRNQFLNFEPPRFKTKTVPGLEERVGTVGGMIASGLSGPGRFFYGGCRESVLGLTILDGNGKLMRFGGSVIKNVAGYDVSRLNVGALGCLGLITEAFLRTYPQPLSETTVELGVARKELSETIKFCYTEQLPISGSFWTNVEMGEFRKKERLYIRLSGKEALVSHALKKISGKFKNHSVMDNRATSFWNNIRDQNLKFFTDKVSDDKILWRISVPLATDVNLVMGEDLIFEWMGALRWVKSKESPLSVRDKVARAGGHATIYHASQSIKEKYGSFSQLGDASKRVHLNLKKVFDPKNIFNKGRLYHFM
ncbi:MAG: glycolate oxidase subunit GlcE [Burkholderiaceae bacterium]|nr:MAG: glycolate oxidase subunit GlcE [Burkholderiaceae bacterium]